MAVQTQRAANLQLAGSRLSARRRRACVRRRAGPVPVAMPSSPWPWSGGVRDGIRSGGAAGAWCAAVAATAAAMLLLCCLAAFIVDLRMACVLVALSALKLAVAACLTPSSSAWRAGVGVRVGVRPSDGAQWEAAVAAAAAAARRRLGMPEAAINALPTFAYAAKQKGAGEDDDVEAGAAGGEPCSVCLEDVQAGETARQLPACKHVFHVECIDMWLHTHRTCPVCRCNVVSPPPEAPGKADAAPAAEPEQPAGDALPPV
ncbi:hypothetical protein ACP4OV_009190 [Aristida adscensionis]